ncbi:ABC transporter substrate-binding protein [Lacisediminimonas sp.]|uniref:ABC transporter substrate-binding protein n=1 Tax=Lacisediminimonas sp. TaxID=3060582 RepID=UPI002721AEBD|nr:transporter substrate-binding domain-containing protein [Lacisediminimonas sp.]MDO8298219.1 transporter substrate-binding domain-containing protein [Lacisediminimonas sp.]
MRNSISGLNHPAFGVRRSALALSLAMLISAGAVGAQTAAAPAQAFNTSQYSAIAAKAAQAQGAPVVVQTNLFLGWTGAWDTVVMKQGNILEKWLPKGSTVEWKRNLQGPPVITDLLANKQNIAYLGDNPSIVATTRGTTVPLRIVAFNLISPGRMCGVLLVRSDAPPLNGPAEVFAWLKGKKVAVPKGSCADRTGQEMLKKAGINVEWMFNQAEVIVTNLQAKKVDAAFVYEPSAASAVKSGFARYVLSGYQYGLDDANTIIMRQDFIDKNRPAAIGWLKANIEALYFMRDNPIETVNLIKRELPDFDRETIWEAMYARMPASTGAGPIVNNAVMTITPQAMDLSNQVFAFLKSNNVVKGELAPGAIDGTLVAQAFTELGLDPKKALFELRGGLPADNPFLKDQLKKK